MDRYFLYDYNNALCQQFIIAVLCDSFQYERFVEIFLTISLKNV